ncbi:glucosyl-3-phosphoglycerate synthase [Chloroflexi bacterium CFX6]|nr:glucosyl-3-phosphoglycerate synthase [Chloroflexi bacterium CFX6]
MTRSHKLRLALVPIGSGSEGEEAFHAAHLIAEEVLLVGVVPIRRGQSISAGAGQAREIRKRLLSMGNENVRSKSTVLVSPTPWKDLQGVIAHEEPDLLIVEWRDGKTIWGSPISEVLVNPVCNVAIVRGDLRARPERTLVAVRGGPFAEMAFQIGMSLNSRQLDVLHISLTGAESDAPFKGMKHILSHIPEANLRSIITDDAVSAILEESRQYDTVVLGTTAAKTAGGAMLGPVAEKLLNESSANLILVKTRRPMPESMLDESAGAKAISILVDKWFAENTFHAEEFSNLKDLLALKEKQGSTISLALPALNEEETVGKVIRIVQKELMEKYPLLDEIVLIDSNSTDRTRQIAKGLGVPVYIHQHLLPEMGSRPGKGEALWKSLLVTKGDIIAWIDTDIVNIHPRFVYGIIGPLLLNRNIQFVKGFYRRPLKVGDKVQAGGGGRVTELTARPLLNLFYPELSGVVQPLSGEYAGRREALEKVPFASGYGVETGLLIDIFEQFGLRAIAQVDLQERIHHNQELEALGKMSFAIIQTVLRKLEPRYERSIIEEVNKTMKLIRYAKGGYFLDVEEVAERERPPMITVPAYQERLKK